MTELLKQLCLLDGISGDEGSVRDLIISQIKDYADITVDPLGSIIAFCKGAYGRGRNDSHLHQCGRHAQMRLCRRS